MYIIIAPHADDEIVWCWSLIKQWLVLWVIYITDAKDWRKEQATKFCIDNGLQMSWMGYRDWELHKLNEIERYWLLEDIIQESKKMKFSKNFRFAIPSNIDRNIDHTVLWGWLPRICPKWSIYYSYTNTLPSPEIKSSAYIFKEKSSWMKKYYPQEEKVLSNKKLILWKCFYKPVTY